MTFEIAIMAAVLLDLIFGDPRWLPHPVKVIGNFCIFFENVYRIVWSNERIAGVCTVVTILSLTLSFSLLVVTVSFSLSPIFGYFVAILLLYTTIAARDLVKHSNRVYHHLHSHSDLEGARIAVGMIVGRDTTNLDKKGVSRACVETVAENMVDGVTAPLFYAVLCGLVSWGTVDSIGFAVAGALTYKAINTMDSMFGYKNEKYLHFGWAAAHLDDVVNFIPARFSGLMLIPTAILLRLDYKNSAKIFFRDRLAHASPNAAHTEAAVAGALDVQLGGSSSYFGKLITKPTQGDAGREIQPEDIFKTNKMMLVGSLLCLLVLLILRRGLEM